MHCPESHTHTPPSDGRPPASCQLFQLTTRWPAPCTPPRLLNTAEDGNFLIIPDRLPGTSVGELGWQPAGGTPATAWGPHPRLHPQEIPWSVAPPKAPPDHLLLHPEPGPLTATSCILLLLIPELDVGLGGFGVESPLMAVAFLLGNSTPRPMALYSHQNMLGFCRIRKSLSLCHSE